MVAWLFLEECNKSSSSKWQLSDEESSCSNIYHRQQITLSSVLEEGPASHSAPNRRAYCTVLLETTNILTTLWHIHHFHYNKPRNCKYHWYNMLLTVVGGLLVRLYLLHGTHKHTHTYKHMQIISTNVHTFITVLKQFSYRVYMLHYLGR